MQTLPAQRSPAARAADQPWLGRIGADFSAAAKTAGDVDWLKVGALGTGIVVGSALIDQWAYDQIKPRVGSSGLRALDNVGSAIPWVGMAGAALAAFDGSDPRRSRTGYAALEAGATALALSTGLKYAFGRARPSTGLKPTNFEPFSSSNSFEAFPSRHVAVAWAVATPFALEYDLPWLYGLAALSNAGRIASGEHWVSDTVAGTLLGYGIGRIFWESSRPYHNGQPRFVVHPQGVDIAWGWD
jgi:membrane-associated phospholipid phosphatase